MATNLVNLADELLSSVLNRNVFSSEHTYADAVKSNPLPPTPIQGQTSNEFAQAHRLGNLYDNNSPKLFADQGGEYAVRSYGLLRTLDVYAISHWFRGIGREFGLFPIQDNNVENKVQRPNEMITKGVTWLASQFLLASLNRGDPQAYGITNQIWNPLSLPSSLIPGTRVATPISNITAGAVLGDYKINTEASIASKTERLLLMRDGLYSEISPVHRLSQIRSPVAVPGFMGDLSKVGEADTLQQEKLPGPGRATVAAQVDGGVLTTLASKLGLNTNVYTSENPYTPTNAIKPLRDLEDSTTPQSDKLSALFSPKKFPGGGSAEFGSLAYAFTNKTSPFIDLVSAIDNNDAPGLNPAVTDAGFPNEDPETNLILKDLIAEENIYMPFMFQDLRDGSASPNEKFLYFRAFLKGDLAETFTPDWQTEKFYGRVDDIPIYLGTSRIISVAFDIVAWSAADLPVIYKKLNKLQSMVYPTYNTTGFMQSGPIIRMRIGDLIAGENNRGLPGYITSLDLSYDDGIWNIQENFKVPRKISVSLSYTVLHDGNPGIYPYQQATINADGTIPESGSQGGTTFGAGKFVANQNKSFTATVSVADIRKIFKSAKEKK